MTLDTLPAGLLALLAVVLIASGLAEAIGCARARRAGRVGQ